MSKLAQIANLIEGGNEFYGAGMQGLTDYHAARETRDSLRKRDVMQRFIAIRHALRRYSVIVSLESSGGIRIYRPNTGKEIIL